MYSTDINAITERFERIYFCSKPQTLIQIRNIGEYDTDIPKKPLGNKIVVLAPDRNELFSMCDILSRNHCIIWYNAKTGEEATEVVRFVRGINNA